MVLIVSMLIGSKNEELRESTQPAKTMMRQFLIFEKTVLSIFQHPTSRFQVFKLVGIRVHMGTGGIKRLILQESMLSVGMKSKVNGITLTKRVSCYRINGKNGTIIGSI
ncbi:Uncharacterised protein [Streptococcus pneumoniae]|nr:Uncharacterised protein [Streptococcus pneumoniae]